MISLAGVNAIVTGSSRGLGLAFARALSAAGANVVINGRSAQACQHAMISIGESGGRIEYVVGSVADESTAQALIDCCQTQFGSVGVVVNNAGITRDKSLLKMTVGEFDEVIAVHLRGTWLMCRAAARAMGSDGGTIINITSGSALFGLVGQSNYAAAKGGINALTRALSVELRRYRVRVNALYPVALTDMTEPVVALSGGCASPLADVFGDPNDVAQIVVALADSSADLITGQILGFDGKDLAVWSHPDRVFRIEHRPPWTEAELRAAVGHLTAHPAMLNPDEVGTRTRDALKAQRPEASGAGDISDRR